MSEVQKVEQVAAPVVEAVVAETPATAIAAPAQEATEEEAVAAQPATETAAVAAPEATPEAAPAVEATPTPVALVEVETPAVAPAVAEASAPAKEETAPETTGAEAAPEVVVAPVVPAAAPAAEAPKESVQEAAVEPVAAEPEAPAVPEPSALEKLTAALPEIIEAADYAEMWGIDLKIPSVPATIVLQKFLKANDGNVETAQTQLTEALKWRADVNPIHQLESTEFEAKFEDLGFVTIHTANDKQNVIAWNIYGAVKDKKATFGNVAEFIKWRSAFMELSVRQLKIDEATEIIQDGQEDPYQMIQVHDYKGVSFLRMDSDTKAATAETIKVLSTAYPELLSHKYFVNVPTIMGFVFSIVKRFVSPATVRKFHPMSSGSSLATELKGFDLPLEYGGSGKSVKEGITVKLAAPAAAAPAEPVAAEAPTESVTESADTNPTRPAWSTCCCMSL